MAVTEIVGRRSVGDVPQHEVPQLRNAVPRVPTSRRSNERGASNTSTLMVLSSTVTRIDASSDPWSVASAINSLASVATSTAVSRSMPSNGDTRGCRAPSAGSRRAPPETGGSPGWHGSVPSRSCLPRTVCRQSHSMIGASSVVSQETDRNLQHPIYSVGPEGIEPSTEDYESEQAAAATHVARPEPEVSGDGGDRRGVQAGTSPTSSHAPESALQPRDRRPCRTAPASSHACTRSGVTLDTDRVRLILTDSSVRVDGSLVSTRLIGRCHMLAGGGIALQPQHFVYASSRDPPNGRQGRFTRSRRRDRHASTTWGGSASRVGCGDDRGASGAIGDDQPQRLGDPDPEDRVRAQRLPQERRPDLRRQLRRHRPRSVDAQGAVHRRSSQLVARRNEGRLRPFRPTSPKGTQIVVVNADGTGLTALTPESGQEVGNPTWSPDGTQIAFERQTPSSRRVRREPDRRGQLRRHRPHGVDARERLGRRISGVVARREADRVRPLRGGGRRRDRRDGCRRYERGSARVERAHHECDMVAGREADRLQRRQWDHNAASQRRHDEADRRLRSGRAMVATRGTPSRSPPGAGPWTLRPSSS